jgi:hypothetical protein
MKLRMNNLRMLGLFLAVLLVFSSCTDLEETVQDGVEFESAATEYAVSDKNSADLLVSAYNALRGPYQDQARLFCLDEHSTDAVVGPTRGGDWDDNGVWRQLHTQSYGPDHGFNRDTWNDIFGAINQTNFVLGSKNVTAQQAAEARFLRALHYYHVIDLWGSAPYREIGTDPNAAAPVYSRAEGTAWIISELEAILTALPAGPSPTVANQNAVHWLLAKIYLNKGVFTAANPAGPYTFDPADMAKVISHVDAITGRSMAADYWDNFQPDNTQRSSELIFVSENLGGVASGNVRSRWFMGQHYNQTPSGWNGFTTLAEYYDKFDPNDERILKWFPETTEKNGYNVGFHIGQQYGPGGPGVGPALKDRPGAPLIFTKELTLITSGTSLETAGIRGVKYVPDMVSGDNANNDFVIARYGEALLMKAEALARTGNVAGAQTIVQSFKNEKTTTIASVDDLLDVRARELWWEGWRRNDRVRFGKFLAPVQLKEYESDPKYILFPIPADALANPNITQNPGY